MPTLRDLREKRKKLIADARAILDRADNESRNRTAEELANYSAAFDGSAALKIEIEDREKLEAEERALEQPITEPARPRPGEAPENVLRRSIYQVSEPGQPGPRATPAYQRAERAWFGRTPNERTPEETRALSVGAATAGGNLVPSEQFVDSLLKAIDNQVFVRALATKYPVTESGTLGVPSITADPADADWTAEVTAVTGDSTMATGKRSMTPSICSKLVQVSRRLLRVAAIPPENLVRDRLAYKFGVTQEKAFLTGDGSGKPLGLFVASASGISTGRDVATDNAATAFTFDGLLNAKYAVKAQYRRNASTGWLFHRDGVKMASKLKSAVDGQYLWQPSKAIGEPDTLSGHAVYESEYVPNTFTTGLYVGLFGDFSFYWIADGLLMEVQRLDELYAATHQVGFIGRAECDGAPVLEEAFARVKLG